MSMIDALEFKPDNFIVIPKEEWRIMSMGTAKRPGVQPRFCWPNCEHYLREKDDKCGRFYECDYHVFDMHKIERGESMMLVMFAQSNEDPDDGLSWWVSEKQLVETMGKRPSGEVDVELGKRIVTAMLAEYNALESPTGGGGIVIT